MVNCLVDILGFRRCSWAVDARLQNLHQRLVYAASDPWVRNRVSLWQLDELHAGLCCWREIDFAFVKVKYVEGSYGFSSSLMGQLHCSLRLKRKETPSSPHLVLFWSSCLTPVASLLEAFSGIRATVIERVSLNEINFCRTIFSVVKVSWLWCAESRRGRKTGVVFDHINQWAPNSCVRFLL